MTLARPAVLALALVLCATSACDSAARPESSAEPSPGHRTITLSPETVPPGVGLSFSQQRIDEGSRRAQVRVSNGTARPLRVKAVGVDWAAFPGPVQPVAYPVPAHTIIDLRYRLPRANCSARAAGSPMSGVVVTDARTIRRDMPADGRRFLERLWRTECAARAVASVVDVGWDVSGDPAEVERGAWLDAVRQIELVVRRTGREGSSVEVAQAQGSVLFELEVPQATLRAGDDAVRVPVEVSPGRCDEHGRSQATQPFTWRVWLSLDGGEPQAVIVSPRQGSGQGKEQGRELGKGQGQGLGKQQEVLLAWLDRACGDFTEH